jgi:hypothetical protein
VSLRDVNVYEVLQRPLCARCNRPVDVLMRHVDVRLREEVWTAACHGETEAVHLDARNVIVDRWEPTNRAFVPYVIESPEQLEAEAWRALGIR